MKYRHIALLLSLLLALTACGAPAASSDSQPAPEPETFGAETVDSAPAPMAETTTAPEPEQAESAAESPAPAVNLDEQVLLSLLLTDCVDGMGYDPMSSGCFWRAVGYLAGHGGGTVEDGRVTLTAEQLDALVTALFGPYEEQYPSLSEEDPFVTEEYVDGQSVYTVITTGPFHYTVNRSEPEPQGDGTYRCRAELTLGEEVLGTRTVTLADYPAADGRFAYCVAGLETE